MKLKTLPLTLAFCFFLSTFLTSGQQMKFKFGDISTEDLSMTKYAKDTSAAAIVLGSVCTVKLEYDVPTSKWISVYTRYFRIKIFNKNGYDWADHKILLYDYGSMEERLRTFKAQTYNLVKGKTVKSKLSRGDLIPDRENLYYKSESFTMPDIQDNCIVEYEYSFQSTFLTQLHEWYFQKTIPVLWSEITVEIPQYFNYKTIMSGYEALSVNELVKGKGTIFINFRERDRSAEYLFTRQTAYANESINYDKSTHRLVAIDMPAFISEPMLTSYENYISKISYELETTQFPNSVVEAYTTTWGAINKLLLDSDRFGSQLDGGYYLNDIADEIKRTSSDPNQRLTIAHEYIKRYMKWNGYMGIHTTSTLRSAYNDRAGSAADINLMLVVLLRKLELDANPVILSTRSNGIMAPFFPSIGKSNYVVAHVKLAGGDIMLDATDHFLTPGLLPERCLNGHGRMVKEGPGEIVELNSPHSSVYISHLNLKLATTGELTGTLNNTRKDYSALNLRHIISQEKSHSDFIETIETKNPGVEITDFKFSNLDSVYKPTEEFYGIEIADGIAQAGNLYYINPMFFEGMKQSPFKLIERKYPVDFAYLRSEDYTLTLEIPEGFVFEELPRNSFHELRGGAVTFTYNAATEGQVLKVNVKLNVNKVLFLNAEYEDLRQLYNTIVEKHAQQVVIKRIS